MCARFESPDALLLVAAILGKLEALEQLVIRYRLPASDLAYNWITHDTSPQVYLRRFSFASREVSVALLSFRVPLKIPACLSYLELATERKKRGGACVSAKLKEAKACCSFAESLKRSVKWGDKIY